MLELLNSLLDALWFNLLVPLFHLFARLLELILITPLAALHIPVALHVCLLAILVAWFSLFLRRILRVEEKAARFNEMFAEKRRRQQDLQLIPEKYSREALYRVTDEELNEMFNRYLAHHYARYVLIYLLPVLLTMAWLNSVFDETYLLAHTGVTCVLPLPENSFGIHGLSVTVLFLFTYLLSLVLGFRLRKRKTL